MEWRRKRSISNEVWGVIVILVLVLSQEHQKATAQGIYACWGGCYNECILQNGKNPSQRLPCYWRCLGSCFSHPASNYHYYCQLGCSLELCIRYISDGGKMERCLENCSNRICSTNL